MEASGEPYTQATVDQGKSSWYTLNRMLCRDKGWSVHTEEEDNLLSL